ncbi:hypothetical protein GQ55_5G530300 [Panicum hallii var. hallii]|uniref:NAC domain-containing protein n=1 Tax=Panicum hallii var. hallii TaxID=1504633 RepID=A0A2T7DT22_9POAL|nr:hypothetical protein GQ55_5G530300 [Panicum hallii var. hallii]
MAADGSLTRHGFPRGYRFVPTQLELIYLLSDRIHRGKLPPAFDRIFHKLRILDYHPEELYEMYREDAQHLYIYFFSWREFQKKGAGGAAPGDKDQKEPRLVRAARGGGWKASGGGEDLRWPRRKGGFFAGRRMTLVFYDRGVDKSNWGMHEFVVPFKNLALYRLYILRSGDMESENDGAGSSSQMLANDYDDHFSPSTAVAPCPPVQPWGIFDAGASTSQMPPQQQHRPSVEHAHYYNHQFAFGAASTGAATLQQAHDMPMHGAGLPGDWCQFASSPAPVPVPPAAADQAAHRADTTAAHGAEQQADCVKLAKEAALPPLEDVVPAAKDEGMADADDYDGPGMPDWNLDFAALDDYSFQFTMEEILGYPALDEPPAMEGDSNSGGENYSNQAGDTKQEPPSALSSYY